MCFQLSRIMERSCKLCFFHTWGRIALSVKHYPWLTPRATTDTMHEVRQYIFYHYQKELAERFGRSPCSNIPASFNHSRTYLDDMLKTIINQNM